MIVVMTSSTIAVSYVTGLSGYVYFVRVVTNAERRLSLCETPERFGSIKVARCAASSKPDSVAWKASLSPLKDDPGRAFLVPWAKGQMEINVKRARADH
jgi:hypothetical protein